MQIIDKPLKDIYKDLRDALKYKLTNAIELKEVQRVVYGESARLGSLQMPAIWIIPEPYIPVVVGGKTAEHPIRFNLVAFVKDNEPERGLERAQDLAFTVYDVIMQDRTLGGIVFDITPTRVDPAYEIGQNSNLYWSAVQFDFKIKRKE